MSSEIIVQHCAPTLAGLKVGNLVSHPYETRDELWNFVEEQNRKLSPKGVQVRVMKVWGKRALLYIYRQRQLARLLARPHIQRFLSAYGYRDPSLDVCLTRLKGRLHLNDFPHEIGVFLGYPLADIEAFIENKGANCPCKGCWKAYTNVDRAKKIFRLYRDCTAMFCQRYQNGADLAQLTVAK